MNNVDCFVKQQLSIAMPKYMEVKAPDDSTYKLCSFLNDEIEPIHPGLWYGAYKMYYLQIQ